MPYSGDPCLECGSTNTTVTTDGAAMPDGLYERDYLRCRNCGYSIEIDARFLPK